MIIQIYGVILRPRPRGDFVVLVCPFPSEPMAAGTMRHRREVAIAADVEQARDIRERLIAEMRAEMEAMGYATRIILVR